jgi:hypothetical protein
MAAVLYGAGPIRWSGGKDDEGFRNYTIVHLVKCDPQDGPNKVMNCPGLPAVGSYWNFGNDVDVWATCKFGMKVKSFLDKDKNLFWEVEQEFSTAQELTKCEDTSNGNPLLEPMRISGSFTKYTEEITYALNGYIIKNSAHEIIKGSELEFDKSRPTVKIGQNVATLGLATFSNMIDCVNNTPMWGLPARCVKLSNVNWGRKYQGTCTPYYSREFDFEIRYPDPLFTAGNTTEPTGKVDISGNPILVPTTLGGFDRQVNDRGKMCLNGYWGPTGWITVPIPGAGGTPNPDPNKPSHFIRFKDRSLQYGITDLKNGVPVTDKPTVSNPVVVGKIDIIHYKGVNFFTLGIPTTL